MSLHCNVLSGGPLFIRKVFRSIRTRCAETEQLNETTATAFKYTAPSCSMEITSVKRVTRTITLEPPVSAV